MPSKKNLGLLYELKSVKYAPLTATVQVQKDGTLWLDILSHKQLTVGMNENVWQRKAVRIKISEEKLDSLMSYCGFGEQMPVVDLDISEIFDIIVE